MNDPLKPQMIGQGERITAQILSRIYPEYMVVGQVFLESLLSKELKDDMGERAYKETVDLVVYRPKPLVIRIQDDRHKTARYGNIDSRQRWELEQSNCDVIDVWKSDCPEVFKGKKIELATREIRKVIEEYLP